MTVERMRTLLRQLRADLAALDEADELNMLPPQDELHTLLDDLERLLDKRESLQ